ncbi:MAG: DNA-directed RNA polymerase subunit N [Thermoplasmata archaeon]|jgi:DNA-directed RNA polymerase subunit N
MMMPIRCFSCGRVIITDYIKFQENVEKIRREKNRDPTSEEIDEIFNSLGVNRYCCRRMIISHVDLIDDVIGFD